MKQLLSTSNILVVIVLYFYIYNPVLRSLGFGFGVVLMLISLFWVFFNVKTFVKYLHYYRTEFLIQLFVIPYVFAICVFNGESDFQTVIDLILWTIFSTCVSIFIVKTLLSHNKRFLFWDTILFVGFIASLISCIALFVPSFNAFLRNIQLELAEGDLNDLQLAFRFYGFAINLSSGYGYIQGLLASLCLLLLDKKHKRYALYFVTLTISVIINARTGVFPIALTIIFLLCKYLFNFKLANVAKLILGALAALGLVAIIISQIPDVKIFIIDFFDQLSLFFGEDGLTDSSYVKMISFPNSIVGLIFGEGYSLYGIDDKWEASDIGYVNQIYIGGIIFAGLLLLYEILVYKKIMKQSKEYIFSTIFFLSMLVFNYKGMNFYAGGAYIKLYILYYFVLVHNQISAKNKIAIT